MIHVVLFEPEIPQNTGNIMRTCVATKSKLHLIEPCGFTLDEKHLKRAGLDYINDLDLQIHPNWEDFVTQNPGEYYYVSRYGSKKPNDFNYGENKGDVYFIFGKESTGIPLRLMIDHLDHQIRIPMVANARSLNLSNCVAIIVYECLRQLDYPFLACNEVLKGPEYHGNDDGKS